MSTDRDPTVAPAWSVAFFSLIHPVQVAAFEAFLSIDEAMSALCIYEMLDRSSSFGTVAYHVRRLADRDVLVEPYVEPVRGAHEHFYALST